MYLWCKYSLIADTVVRGMCAKVLSALCGRQMHADLNSWDFYLSPHEKYAASCPHLEPCQGKKDAFPFFLSFSEIQWGRGLACMVLSKRRASPVQLWYVFIWLKMVRFSSLQVAEKQRLFFFSCWSLENPLWRIPGQGVKHTGCGLKKLSFLCFTLKYSAAETRIDKSSVALTQTSGGLSKCCGDCESTRYPGRAHA